jgi:hypothetical protein
MNIPPPQPVANLTDPAGTIYAIRLLAEARPQGDPRVYLREVHRLPPGVCRKAGDLYLHRQTPIVAAIVALAEAFGALELSEIKAMCLKRVPEAGAEQIQLAAMWMQAMSPASWSLAMPPALDGGDVLDTAQSRNRPQREWPMSGNAR